MMDWKSRIKNKAFWLALVPATLLVAQIVAGWFGYNWDMVYIGQQAAAFINAIFAVLTILGVLADPTTDGFSDEVAGKHVKDGGDE